MVVDSKRLKEQMYKDKKIIAHEGKKKRQKDDGTLVIDLHADELLETTAGMNAADILHYQLDVFKKTMDENKKKKGQKISSSMARERVCCAMPSFMNSTIAISRAPIRMLPSRSMDTVLRKSRLSNIIRMMKYGFIKVASAVPMVKVAT